MDCENSQIYINPPFFNFIDAENYGFDLESFQLEGFKLFMTSTFINDFIKLRKNYIAREINELRFMFHKIKGCFRY